MKNARVPLVLLLSITVFRLPVPCADASEHVHYVGGTISALPSKTQGYVNTRQEEVFLVMRGGGEIEIEGERFPLDSDHIARVGPETKRKVWPGPEGIRMVVLGGVPGEAYVPGDITKLGEPDPMAAA